MDTQLKVRKIQNGYIITYQVPKEKKGKYRGTAEEEMGAYFFFTTSPSESGKTLEWYCPTKEKVKEALPRIALEAYHAFQLDAE